jgi:hypothetical protein
MPHPGTSICRGRYRWPSTDVDKIAWAAVFLASEDSKFFNGVELLADSGLAQT